MAQRLNQDPMRFVRREIEAGVGTVERASRTAGHAAESALGAMRQVEDRAKKLRSAAPMLRQAVTPLLTGRVDWKAEYAYTAGVQAFIYGFPYIYNAQIRHDWVTNPRDPEVVPYAAVNEFWNAARLLDATYRDGGCPNNDTLYSLAWLDLSDEPVVLSHPDMGERYFTFELMSFTSDNFDYVGQRTTGTEAGDFAITGPAWEGQLPQGVRTVAPSPTPWVLVLGRTLVDGPKDLPQARALQQQFRLTPLSSWGKPKARSKPRRDVYAPVGLRRRPARSVEDAQRHARRESTTRPPFTGARPVRADRDRAGPRRRRPAGRRQAGPDPSSRHRHGTAPAAVPQRRLGHHRERLALPAAARGPPGRRLPAPGSGPVAGRHHRQRPRRVGLPGQLRRCRRARSSPSRDATNSTSTRTSSPRWTRSGPWPPTPPGIST